jgi:hypothetical protein
MANTVPAGKKLALVLHVVTPFELYNNVQVGCFEVAVTQHL